MKSYLHFLYDLHSKIFWSNFKKSGLKFCTVCCIFGELAELSDSFLLRKGDIEKEAKESSSFVFSLVHLSAHSSFSIRICLAHSSSSIICSDMFPKLFFNFFRRFLFLEFPTFSVCTCELHFCICVTYSL